MQLDFFGYFIHLNFNNFTDAETGKKYKNYRQDGIDKTFEYTVIWKIQKLSLDSESTFNLLARNYSVDFQKEEEKRDYSYEGNRENPYIASKKARMISPLNWISTQSEAYKEKVVEKLKSVWINHTCKRSLEQSNKYKQGDLSMRCSLAQDARFQDHVDSWFTKNFSVKEEQAKYVLKF